MFLAEYMPHAKGMLSNLKEHGEQYNLKFSDITYAINTNKALQLAEYAKETNKSLELLNALYYAVFVDDINISTIAELKKIAKSVGISNEEVDQVFSTDKYKLILDDNKDYCRKNNITSVPTFIINDKHTIVGAPSISAFTTILDKLKKEN